jgi:hypothetical protein
MCDNVLNQRLSPDCEIVAETVHTLGSWALHPLHAQFLQQSVLQKCLDRVCFSPAMLAGQANALKASVVLCTLAVDHVLYGCNRETSDPAESKDDTQLLQIE